MAEIGPKNAVKKVLFATFVLVYLSRDEPIFYLAQCHLFLLWAETLQSEDHELIEAK